jgi:hypothetical protein
MSAKKDEIQRLVQEALKRKKKEGRLIFLADGKIVLFPS